MCPLETTLYHPEIFGEQRRQVACQVLLLECDLQQLVSLTCNIAKGRDCLRLFFLQLSIAKCCWIAGTLHKALLAIWNEQ